MPGHGEGELAACPSLSVTRLPKLQPACQVECKAHSRRGSSGLGLGSSAFPFLLSNPMTRNKRGDTTRSDRVHKTFRVHSTPLLKLRITLCVSWRLFLHFAVFPLDCFHVTFGCFNFMLLNKSFPSLLGRIPLFWEIHPIYGKFQLLTTKRTGSIGMKIERLNHLSSTVFFMSRGKPDLSYPQRTLCAYLHIWKYLLVYLLGSCL